MALFGVPALFWALVPLLWVTVAPTWTYDWILDSALEPFTEDVRYYTAAEHDEDIRTWASRFIWLCVAMGYVLYLYFKPRLPVQEPPLVLMKRIKEHKAESMELRQEQVRMELELARSKHRAGKLEQDLRLAEYRARTGVPFEAEYGGREMRRPEQELGQPRESHGQTRRDNKEVDKFRKENARSLAEAVKASEDVRTLRMQLEARSNEYSDAILQRDGERLAMRERMAQEITTRDEQIKSLQKANEEVQTRLSERESLMANAQRRRKEQEAVDRKLASRDSEIQRLKLQVGELTRKTPVSTSSAIEAAFRHRVTLFEEDATVQRMTAEQAREESRTMKAQISELRNQLEQHQHQQPLSWLQDEYQSMRPPGEQTPLAEQPRPPSPPRTTIDVQPILDTHHSPHGSSSPRHALPGPRTPAVHETPIASQVNDSVAPNEYVAPTKQSLSDSTQSLRDPAPPRLEQHTSSPQTKQFTPVSTTATPTEPAMPPAQFRFEQQKQTTPVPTAAAPTKPATTPPKSRLEPQKQTTPVLPAAVSAEPATPPNPVMLTKPVTPSDRGSSREEGSSKPEASSVQSTQHLPSQGSEGKQLAAVEERVGEVKGGTSYKVSPPRFTNKAFKFPLQFQRPSTSISGPQFPPGKAPRARDPNTRSRSPTRLDSPRRLPLDPKENDHGNTSGSVRFPSVTGGAGIQVGPTAGTPSQHPGPEPSVQEAEPTHQMPPGPQNEVVM